MEGALRRACSEARPWEMTLAPGHRRGCGGVHPSAVHATEPSTPTRPRKASRPEALDAFGMEEKERDGNEESGNRAAKLQGNRVGDSVFVV